MPTEAIELEVGSRVVRVSNPDKVYFPGSGHTKLDLVQYYLSVADGIVRALYDRPTQLCRFPDGGIVPSSGVQHGFAAEHRCAFWEKLPRR